MKKATLYAGGTAVLLALSFGVSACSGDPAAEEPSSSAVSTNPSEALSEAPSEAPSDEPSGEPTEADSTEPASTGTQYTADELEAVLTAINEAEALNAQVIPDAELRPLLEGSAAEGLEDIVVTPEECNVFAESDLPELTAEANLAVMTFAGESSLQPDTLSLSSVPSEETIAEQLAASRTQLEQCSEFEMEISGQVVTAAVQELETETDAEEEVAVQTTVQVPGSVQESVTVTGFVGSTSINVLVGSSGDPQADVERAAGLINLAVAELAKL
ncbi:hypothetical protein BJ994_001003 [Arthrobacter pigmenti]|uniref:PknH-like extracellular domain-containing protein n=1 Tax=Arthrobacter pigmenti TaxID=271432 RepID=A0A846RP45_9MICC|nr:hypothetical protein [Arthrobacter pigmenti]NJC21927.1 hypothetical protein [Arthrobacter pigmenti]